MWIRFQKETLEWKNDTSDLLDAFPIKHPLFF